MAIAEDASTPPPGVVKDQVSAEEWALRQELAAAYRMFAHWGWDDLVFTHLSVRVPGPEQHFLLNPYNLMFDEITASSLIKVDMAGETVLETPHVTNPAGFVIHSALHMAREDACCVMHLHTIAGQAVSAQEHGLLPSCQTSIIAQAAGVAYHDYEGIATEEEERERLIADMGRSDVMILRNHGLLTVGETIADAFIRMYFLERGCQAQIAALSGGGKLYPASSSSQDKAKSQAQAGVGLVGQLLAWPAVRRKMERLYPDHLT